MHYILSQLLSATNVHMQLQFVLFPHDVTCYRVTLCTCSTAVYCAMYRVFVLVSVDPSSCNTDCTMLRVEGYLELHENYQVCCYSSDNLNERERERRYAKDTHEDLCSKGV